MNPVSTRIATVHDVAGIAPLFDAYRQFYQQASDLSLSEVFVRERILNNESVIIVSESDGQLNGFCQMYPSYCSVSAAPIYILYDLFVRPESRKNGAGRALLLAAEQHAVVHGISRIDLSTAKNNLPAQALYESLGWMRDDVFFTYNKKIVS